VLVQTQSADFPTTPDAVQREFAGPRRDVFVLKLDAAGKIVYSTLLGGSKNDEPGGFAVADDGTVYVSGTTWSDESGGANCSRRAGLRRAHVGVIRVVRVNVDSNNLPQCVDAVGVSALAGCCARARRFKCGELAAGT